MKKHLITLFLFLFCTQMSYAQSVSLSISPPLIDILIKPSKSLLIAYTVENSGDPTIVKAQIRDFIPRGIHGGLQLQRASTSPARFSLDNSDLTLGQPFLLKSRGKKQLLLRIRMPEGVPNGDYYQALSIETDSGAQFQGLTSVKNSVTIATPILLTVTDSGATEQKGEISLFEGKGDLSFSLFGHHFELIESNSPLPIRLIVSNTGANRIVPSGKIEVESQIGDTSEYTILPDNILVKSERLLHASPSAVITCDTRSSSNRCGDGVSLVDSTMHIGKVTARASLNFGPGTDLQYASFTMIALPLRFLFALGLILGLSSGIYIATQKKTTSGDQM